MPGIWFDGPGGGGGIAAVVDDTSPQLGGNLDANGFTVDGRTVATDGTKLDGVEAAADVTDVTNVTAAGALMDSELTDIVAVKAASDASIAVTNTGTSTTAFVTPAGLKGSALQTKVDGIEALADVTDAVNVAAAGAPIISSGAGAPGSTPSAEGDIYVDTTGDITWIAAGIASSADWKQATGAGGGDLLASNNLSDVAVAATAFANIKQAASTTASGVAELATITETNTGTDALRVVTPAGLAGSALQSKVDGIEAGATADQTGAQIKVAYEAEADTNAFADADVTKLGGIEALADVTDVTNVTAAGAAMLTGATFTGDVTATDFIGPLNGAVQFTAKNTSGGTITKGQAVYISGISGNTPTVALADADDTSLMPAFGLAAATALDTETLEVVTFGSLKGIQTDYAGWALGDTLYISTTAGTLTNTPPAGEGSLIQNIGSVERLHSSNGTIKVGGAGRTNATPNLDDGNVFIGNASNQSAARALVVADTTGLQAALDGKQAYQKNNDVATAAPGVSNDTSEGYTVGSRWTDVTADTAYTALDVSSGAAVWAAISGGGGLSGGDGDVIGYQPLLYATDGRSTTLTYTGDDLTQVLEKNGATTVKQTDLTYTGTDLTSVVELADGVTVTTTLTYTGDNLTSTGRVVT